MPTPTRQCPLTLRIADEQSLDVRHFTVRSRVHRLYEVELEALSPHAALPFDDLIGREATFAWGAPYDRVWNGICRDIEQVRVEPDGLSTYRVTIVPRLWLASQRRNHRMFQQLSDPDIVLQLLAEWDIDHEIAFDRGAHATRKYRVQYGESDFTFMSRLLEDAGLAFVFANQSKLVISDALNEADPPGGPLLFTPDDQDLQDMTRGVSHVKLCRRVRPGAYTIRDHDYRRPAEFELLASASAPTPTPEPELERFHYVPGAFLFGADGASGEPSDDRGATRHSQSEGARIAKRRLEAKRAEAERIEFRSTAFELLPGETFHIDGHPNEALREDRRFLLLETRVSGGSNDVWEYLGCAVCTEQPYRPPLATPKPRTRGVESATVVGPAGEEIHCDEFGRVRVHFHWDRESQMNDESSCWIHVSQPWSGTGFGGTNLPRIGQEVLVDFLGGDPDRPVIIGRVYTNVNKTPYKLPDNKTQSGWRSMSSPGGGGYNELMFEDAKGNERVNLQAEKDMNTLVKHDQDHAVGRDRDMSIRRHLQEMVGQTMRTVIGRAVSTVVGLTSSEQVGLHKRIDVGSVLEVHVGKSHLVMKRDGEITLTGVSIKIEGEKVKVIGDPIELN